MENENQKVSVIITCYNYGEYLADAIQSVLNQSYKDFELIVVDDGSTDSTFKVCKRYLGVKYIYQTNRGLPSARNIGLMNSTGNYILPLDADDMIAPTYLEKAVKLLKETNSDIIYPDLQFFGDRNDRAICNAPFDKIHLRQENLLPYCSMIRKECLSQCGGWNVKMIYGFEDWELWIELFERGYKFTRLPEFMFLYRKHGGLTMIGKLMQTHFHDCIKQLVEIHPKFFN